MKLTGVEKCLFPGTLEEAAEILEHEGDNAAVVGGGLGIITARESAPGTLIFLEKIPLKYIKKEQNHLKVGARTSLSEFMNSPVLEKYLSGKVRSAMEGISTHLIRNQITLGGAVAGRAPYSDIVTLLMALRAKVVLRGQAGQKILSIDEYYGDFQDIRRQYIIEEIQLPEYGGDFAFAMERFTRNATDITLLNMAVLVKIEIGKVEEASVTVGSRPEPAYRFPEGEEFLKGKALSEDLARLFEDFVREKVDVRGDFRISEDYRRHVSGVFARRIVESLGGAS